VAREQDEGTVAVPDADITSRVSAGSLAALLAVAAERPTPDEADEGGETVEETLDRLLAGRLPLPPGAADELAAALGRTREKLLALAGRTVGDLLLDPQTDPAVLRFLKEYGRERASWGETDAECAAGTIVYCAAIAGGLTFHKQKITSFPYAGLAAELAKLLRKECVPAPFTQLFAEAVAVCRAQERLDIEQQRIRT
jgi:hypothetical protein